MSSLLAQQDTVSDKMLLDVALHSPSLLAVCIKLKELVVIG